MMDPMLRAGQVPTDSRVPHVLEPKQRNESPRWVGPGSFSIATLRMTMWGLYGGLAVMVLLLVWVFLPPGSLAHTIVGTAKTAGLWALSLGCAALFVPTLVEGVARISIMNSERLSGWNDVANVYWLDWFKVPKTHLSPEVAKTYYSVPRAGLSGGAHRLHIIEALAVAEVTVTPEDRICGKYGWYPVLRLSMVRVTPPLLAGIQKDCDMSADEVIALLDHPDLAGLTAGDLHRFWQAGAFTRRPRHEDAHEHAVRIQHITETIAAEYREHGRLASWFALLGFTADQIAAAHAEGTTEGQLAVLAGLSDLGAWRR